MSRTWALGDEVAESRGGRWRRGVFAGYVGVGLVEVHWDNADQASYTSYRIPDVLVDPDEVPTDERPWLSQAERDQLVRQEASVRLHAFAEEIVVDPVAAGYLREIAADLAEPLVEDPKRLTAAARALFGLPETDGAPPNGPAAPHMEPR